ncbi:hypothetical protein JMUB7550_27640 [Staphylococcus aureus]
MKSNASPNVIGYTRRDSAYWRDIAFGVSAVSYTHLTLPTILRV